MLQSELLTSGSVNANTVRFNFSRDWSGLVKTVIFQTAEHSIDVILDDGTSSTMVPWEVLTTEGQTVSIGVYGVRIREDGENELVLPTVWGVLGPVVKGVSPSKPSEANPTKDAYAELLEKINNIEVSQGVRKHPDLEDRNLPNQHNIDSIEGLSERLSSGITDEDFMDEVDIKNIIDNIDNYTVTGGKNDA